MTRSLLGITIALISMIFTSFRNICSKSLGRRGVDLGSIILGVNLVFFGCGLVVMFVRLSMDYEYVDTGFNY